MKFYHKIRIFTKMNIHRKITEIGFKRCEFHRMEYDYKYQCDSMILDDYEDKTEWVGHKRIVIRRKKIHPKWNYFYKLKFTDDVIIWALIEQSAIKNIWLEMKPVSLKTNRVTIIYDQYSNRNTPLNSKVDIIKLFPKEIQRDFVLNSLFK